MKKTQIEWFKIFVILLFLALLVYLTFSKYGIIDYFNTKAELNKLKEELVIKEKLVKKMEARIDSLKTDLKLIEKIAREKYRMHKPNEQIIKIEKVK